MSEENPNPKKDTQDASVVPKNSRRRDYFKLPRIELIPTLVLFPIVTGILVVLSFVPETSVVLNEDGGAIFGKEANYTRIFLIISIILVTYFLLLIIFTAIPRTRKKVPIALYTISIGIFLLIDIVAAYAISNHDILSFNYIYVLLGQTLGRYVFIVLIVLLPTLVFYMIYGVKKLWNYLQTDRSSTKRKIFLFRPRVLSIISIIGFLIAAYIPFLLVINHTSMGFWYIIFHNFDWNSFTVINHLIFAALYIYFQISNQISKMKKSNRKMQKFYPIFAGISIVPQVISIIITSWSRGIRLTLLNPLSILTMLEIVLSLILDVTIPQITKKGHFKVSRKKMTTRILVASLVIPLVWLVFYQPLITPVPPRPEIEHQSQSIVKSNSYTNLTTTQQEIFDGCLDYYAPPGTTANASFAGSSRSMVRVADGLLFRNAPGDIGNSSILLQMVIDRQESEADTNWYAFRGSELCILLEHHESKLDPVLVTSLHEMLIHGAKLLRERFTRPSYTNIAMMSAFVMQYVGFRFDIPYLRDAGIIKAWEIYVMFCRFNTVSEYNSPTYYGVDLVAMAQWRECGPTVEMRAMGSQLEHRIWIEMSENYHAGFKNLVGPYTRSYGMVMHQHMPIASMYIALALNNISLAPLSSEFSYDYNEYTNIFMAVELGHVVPEEPYFSAFTTFSGARYIERDIAAELFLFGEKYKVTATITEKWMMGGIFGRRKDSNQFRVGTIHWNSTINNSLGWLLASGIDTLDVCVSGNKMTIFNGRKSTPIVFYVNCKNLTQDMFTTSTWNLPGINIEVDGDYSKITAEIVDSNTFRSKGQHYLRHGVDIVVKITCDLNSVLLTLVG